MSALDALGIADKCLPAEAFAFCIISGKRAEQVPKNMAKFKKSRVSPTFFVCEKEGPAYRGYLGVRDATSEMVVESGGLCASRNAALEFAESRQKICVQMSDDIQHLTLHVIPEAARYWTSEPACEDEAEVRVSVEVGNQRAKDSVKFQLTPVECAQIIMFQMQRQGANLGGTCIHGNGGFAFNTSSFVAVESFILGDFMVINTRLEGIPRFDSRLSLKEDYDFTASHLLKYGKVCRVLQILIVVDHRENHGGAVFYRHRALERSHIQFLKAKWPGVFHDNLSRQGPGFTIIALTLPFRLERREEGFVVADISLAANAERINKDSISALHKGMRLIRADGEDLRKSDPTVLKTILDKVECLLYGSQVNGVSTSAKRPLDLVFGFTPECPPVEVYFHWDKRDVSIGGSKEVEKVEFPPDESLQKKVAQHTTQRQPSIYEFLSRTRQDVRMSPRPTAPQKPDSATRLRNLLDKHAKGKEIVAKREIVDASDNQPRKKRDTEPSDITVETLEQGVEMFMYGHSMAEVTEKLALPEAELQKYMMSCDT